MKEIKSYALGMLYSEKLEQDIKTKDITMVKEVFEFDDLLYISKDSYPFIVMYIFETKKSRDDCAKRLDKLGYFSAMLTSPVTMNFKTEEDYKTRFEQIKELREEMKGKTSLYELLPREIVDGDEKDDGKVIN